ncbi:ParB domain protein nuclease [Parafrankia sp. EAN1pec]|uniref:ParB/RepB/Spo0J family partition protein n=1 Tax=Parafrankia sp. (strain EAN1pec) TaxID=298653 RepID=UPI00015D9CB6|nr:ParB domain protein nuclease [Frankia sp. EAN1pec]
MPAPPDLQVTHVDPASLLLDRNIRSDADLDADFLASIRDNGVLIPIIAVQAPDGMRVRHGERRTRAALHAGLATVPVLIIGDDSDDQAAEISRIVTQWAENQHRSALDTRDQVHAVGQLAVFGLTPTKIARRLRAPRRHVEAALTVAGSPTARDALTEHGLDLFQAVVIAEFADDPDAVATLIRATGTSAGGFDHTAQRLRDARADQQARNRVLDELRQNGVRIINRPTPTDPACRLSLLDHDRTPLTPADHTSCPGHAAYLIQDYDITGSGPFQVTYLPEYVCTHPDAYGHIHRYATPATDTSRHPGDTADTDSDDDTSRDHAHRATDSAGGAEDASRGDGSEGRSAGPAEQPSAEEVARRQQILENTQAWQSATAVRRGWLRTFLARRTPPKGTSRFVADQLATAHHDLTRALDQHHPTARLLLGTTDSPLTPARLTELIAQAGEHRAQILTLALILGAHEHSAGAVDSWQHPTPALRRYLTQLETWGYALADVERLAANPPVQPDQPDQPGSR